jgi:outer membrane immunogenic protein
MKNLLLAGAAIALAAAPAAAADMAVKAPYQPPPVAAYDWSGIYVGGHIGWAWQHTTFNDPFSAIFGPSGPPVRSFDPKSFFGGPQIGWNYQIGHLVVGNEVDASFTALNAGRTDAVSVANPAPGVLFTSDTRTISTKTDWFGTATARLGFAWDRVLLYSKGGAAVAHFKYGVDDSSFLSTGISTTLVTLYRGSDTRIGWTVGAGVEWAVWENLSAKVEYDYLGFANKPVALDPIVGFVGSPQLVVNVEHSIQTVKAGLNWRFGPTAPVTARY